MRRIVICAALTGSLLLAGASPALAAPRAGLGSADLSAWLEDVLDRIVSRFFTMPEPQPAGDPYAKNGCELDPNGKPTCPTTVLDPAVPRSGRTGDPYAKEGCEMDPSGKPTCLTNGGQASRRPAGQELARPD